MLTIILEGLWQAIIKGLDLVGFEPSDKPGVIVSYDNFLIGRVLTVSKSGWF